MFNSIVVGFDGSAHASRALEIGATMAARDELPLGILVVVDGSAMQVPESARRMGEAEHILNPQPKILVDFSMAPATTINSIAQLSADSERALFEYSEFLVDQAEKMASEHGAKNVEVSSVQGHPADQIVKYAKQRSADLIIIGCRGFGKFKRLVLGSTSQRVTQLARCSCLTVK